MKNFKGTKGKWEVIPSGLVKSDLIITSNIKDILIAKVDKSNYENDAEAEANARLIASSLELLDTLIILKESMEKSYEMVGASEADKERLAIVKNAIKEATL